MGCAIKKPRKKWVLKYVGDHYDHLNFCFCNFFERWLFVYRSIIRSLGLNYFIVVRDSSTTVLRKEHSLVKYITYPSIGILSNSFCWICSIPPLSVVGLSEEDAVSKAKGDILVYTSSFNPMKNTISGYVEQI